MSFPPTALPARIASLDALRALALCGILIVNSQLFGSALGFLGHDPSFDAPRDQAVRLALAVFFEGKCYLLFAFFFGYSFALQAAAAARASASVVTRTRRRLAALWVLGLLHATLLFYGDILSTYAVMGLVLLAWRDKTDAQLWRTACWLVASTVMLWAAIAQVSDAPLAANAGALQADAVRVSQAYTATAAQAWRQNLSDLGLAAIALAFVQAPMALAMFCLGLMAARHGLLAHPERHTRLLARMRGVGLTVGLPGALVYAGLTLFAAKPLLGFVVGLATAPFLSAAYVAWGLQFLSGPRGARWQRMLAPAGRMALSHYLLQSLILAWLFYAYGWGLMGKLSPAAVLILAVSIFLAQVAISHLWLRHFTQGWMEWLLRAVTLGRRPAWRRTPSGSPH